MSLILTAGKSTVNIPYTAKNGEFNYNVNVSKTGDEFTSLNGNITSGETSFVQIGNFNVFGQNSSINYNINQNIETTNKQSILADIDDIVSQLMK